MSTILSVLLHVHANSIPVSNKNEGEIEKSKGCLKKRENLHRFFFLSKECPFFESTIALGQSG